MDVQINTLEIDRTLARVLRGLKDATPLARLVGEEMTLLTDDRFRDENDPDGSPWAALSPRYVAWKQRKGHITKILQMRGDLRARVAYQPYPDRVEIGSDTPYARRQHAVRPFLYSKSGGLGRRDAERIAAVAEAYLQSLVDGRSR